MTTLIPHMKLNDHYVGLFTGASKVRLYKIYGKVESTNTLVNFDYQLGYLGEFKFRRRDIRKGNWKEFNILFDDDWDVTENNVMFALISKQGAFSGTKDDEITLSGNVKIGYDESKKEASTSSVTTVEYEIKLGKGERLKLRYKDKISRRGALANVVGDQLLHGVYSRDDVDYTIRAADKLRFYFMHNITKDK